MQMPSVKISLFGMNDWNEKGKKMCPEYVTSKVYILNSLLYMKKIGEPKIGFLTQNCIARKRKNGTVV